MAVRVPGAVDPEAVRVSHGSLLPALQIRVPPPVLVTLTAWAEGFAPPWTPLNVRLAGLRPMVGEDGGGGGGGGERMACTSGRWVSLRGGLAEPGVVPGCAAVSKLPVVGRGPGFTKPDGIRNWGEGIAVEAATPPIETVG